MNTTLPIHPVNSILNNVKNLSIVIACAAGVSFKCLSVQTNISSIKDSSSQIQTPSSSPVLPSKPLINRPPEPPGLDKARSNFNKTNKVQSVRQGKEHHVAFQHNQWFGNVHYYKHTNPYPRGYGAWLNSTTIGHSATTRNLPFQTAEDRDMVLREKARRRLNQ